jgi:hypothetical protein
MFGVDYAPTPPPNDLTDPAWGLVMSVDPSVMNAMAMSSVGGDGGVGVSGVGGNGSGTGGGYGFGIGPGPGGENSVGPNGEAGPY